MNNIRVLVRVRPPTKGKGDSESVSLVHMPAETPQKTILDVPSTSSFHLKTEADNRKEYEFDECIWSYDNHSPNFVNNLKFYQHNLLQILDHAFLGYNVCFLAYGQTGSGKTHSMMGSPQDPGLIPLLLKDLLRRREKLVAEKVNCVIRALYMEIYNEHVKDLLVSNGGGGGGGENLKKCKVREHPQLGPYVENLLDFPINNFLAFLSLLERGNRLRSTAATQMNEQSSRSHAIITLLLVQTKFKSISEDSEDLGEAEEELVSNIKLVDLAGSERLSKTKIYKEQDRLKEGTLINKSLTVLGRCINILSNASETDYSDTRSSQQPVVPFRDSVLTYLLKENLGGNSKTFMLFCVSPLDFEETYQTLNYADRVKRIKTTAKANKKKITGTSKTKIDWTSIQYEDPSMTNDLRDEINVLTKELEDLRANSLNKQVDEEEKWKKLTTFLESQTETLRFENKYLHTILRQRGDQIEELSKQLSYMYMEIQRNQSLNQSTTLQQFEYIKSGLKGRCSRNQKQIESDLKRFDPNSVLV